MRRVTILTVSLLMLVGAGTIAFADTDTINSGYYFGDANYIYRLTPTPPPPGATGVWDWVHNPIGPPAAQMASAFLSITAYDVDSLNENNQPTNLGAPGGAERDGIYGYDADTSSYLFLGYLAGFDNQLSTTEFDIPAALFDDINDGLNVQIRVDELNNLAYPWATRVDESELVTAAIPEPATMLLLGSGLIGMGIYARRRFRK